MNVSVRPTVEDFWQAERFFRAESEKSCFVASLPSTLGAKSLYELASLKYCYTAGRRSPTVSPGRLSPLEPDPGSAPARGRPGADRQAPLSPGVARVPLFG